MAISIGIKLPGLIPRYAPTLTELPALVEQFETMGFDDVVDGEHILFGPRMEHPGGAGTMIHGRDTQQSDRADTLVTFSAIAARTTTIKMFSGIILGAAHNFAVLARQAATLDVLSGGRFVLGVGSGWFAGEFEAVGIPAAERDARLEETVRACQELWSPGLSSFDGKWIRFDDVVSEPAPITPGGVPVWWGGNALRGRTAQRVAKIGRGWLAREAAGYDELARSVDAIRQACTDAGRDPSTLGFRASLTSAPAPGEAFDPDAAINSLEALRRAGITHVTVPLNYYRLELGDVASLLGHLREVADRA